MIFSRWANCMLSSVWGWLLICICFYQVLGFGEYIEEVYAAYEQHKLETMVIVYVNDQCAWYVLQLSSRIVFVLYSSLNFLLGDQFYKNPWKLLKVPLDHFWAFIWSTILVELPACLKVICHRGAPAGFHDDPLKRPTQVGYGSLIIMLVACWCDPWNVNMVYHRCMCWGDLNGMITWFYSSPLLYRVLWEHGLCGLVVPVWASI